MRLLLPPSESKADGTTQQPLDLQSLTFTELTDTREIVISQLEKLCSGSKVKARAALEISAKQDFELERNTHLRSAPTGKAWEIYTGVLYDALDAKNLSASTRKRVTENTYVVSALFGLIGFSDCIPAYRLSGNTKISQKLSLTKLWSPRIQAILQASDDLIVDLRSGTYVALGPLPDHSHAAVPKIFQKMPSGPPKVVTHHNKATKGRIARALMSQRTLPKNVDDVAQVIAQLGADVTIDDSGKHPTINVVVGIL